jgi:hypothetical protein
MNARTRITAIVVTVLVVALGATVYAAAGADDKTSRKAAIGSVA